MDSLTQIVLGAACGEAVLGKKIGNKALLFGAIGGTIPDLDVLIGPWIYDNEIQAMAFHRGFMHSIVFSIIGAFAIGWFSFKLYDSGKRVSSTNLKDWQQLFFWSLFTHPILDCFTPYGTQLFFPFSDYRVAFNNIAVVDPLYTLPFLICLIVILFLKRQNLKRRLWLKLGIGLSSAYMIFTLFNKTHVNSIYKSSLKSDNIVYKRFQTQPTIFNNILWYGVAETESFYYVGFYSILDENSKVDKWIKIEKQHSLIPMEDKNLSKLSWFSNGYYHIETTDVANEFIYKDLRYPLLNPEASDSSIFRFRIFNENGIWDMKNSGPEFEEDMSISEMFAPMLKRLKGL
ncbi:metal-dependent hydrolase [Winogradskyella ursingii]|uniref:metal-dependent hydrolase n=1 Tax=Winogradskyella ursingii TaxID=2686079 RepID=UPI0015CDF260|nr:metal-dependent hydrolase [Winogradskyella ursingii]